MEPQHHAPRRRRLESGRRGGPRSPRPSAPLLPRLQRTRARRALARHAGLHLLVRTQHRPQQRPELYGQHARLAVRRGGAPVEKESFRALSHGGQLLCVGRRLGSLRRLDVLAQLPRRLPQSRRLGTRNGLGHRRLARPGGRLRAERQLSSRLLERQRRHAALQPQVLRNLHALHHRPVQPSRL